MILRLVVSLLISICILVVELLGFEKSHSVALLSDAGHIASDIMAHAISILGLFLSRKSTSNRFPLGMRKAEPLASLVNGILLVLMGIWIFRESWERLGNENQVDPVAMLLFSFTGLIANLVSIALLFRYSKENMNIRSTYLHALGDLLGTLGVVIGSLLIYIFQKNWIDVLVSFLICSFILKSSFQIIRDSFIVLNDGLIDNPRNSEILHWLSHLENPPFHPSLVSRMFSDSKLICTWKNQESKDILVSWEKKIRVAFPKLEIEHRYFSEESLHLQESLFQKYHHHHHGDHDHHHHH